MQNPSDFNPAPSAGSVFVTYGVYQMHLELAGRTLSEVRQSLAGPLNIDPRSVAVVNGQTVAEAFTLSGGDRIEFVRLAGQKGSVDRRQLRRLLPHRTCDGRLTHPS